MSKFSKNLIMLRKACKLTQLDVAIKVGVTQQCISEWENSKIEPTLSFLWKLADIFETSIDDLVGRDVFYN